MTTRSLSQACVAQFVVSTLFPVVASLRVERSTITIASRRTGWDR